MNRRIVMLIIAASSMVTGLVNGFGEKTFFSTRSESVSAVRDLVGWQQEINRVEKNMYTVFSIVPEYSRSFTPDKIAKTLFGSRCLTFSGSRYNNRGKNDILSDNFGLPSDFKSIVSFSPHITNFLMDFGWYHGLDAWLPGLFYRVHMPIVHAKWDLNMCEKTVSPGQAFNPGEVIAKTNPAATYPAGYLGPERILLDSKLPRSMTEAFEGKKVFGDMCDPLRFGKIFGRQTMTRSAEIQCAVGWNFLRADWYHAGASVRIAAPTGNRPGSEFLFEPIIGNGGHWELGAGFTSHVRCWQSEDERHNLSLYSDLNVSHLFGATQKRSFDFTKSGTGSRYMLLSEIAPGSRNLFIDDDGMVPASSQYQRRLVPAINKTTLDTTISVAAQVDFVLKLAYQRENLEIDLGYNLWARSKEKMQRCERFESNRFGIKGDAQLYGFSGNNSIPLNATQSCATILGGQGAGNAKFENSNADREKTAFSGDNILNVLNNEDAELLLEENPFVNLSNPAILLQDSDLNLCSAILPHAISHKIFTHINYTWRDSDDFTPYLGIGSAVEWACDCFKKNSAHSQWSIWLKGGISY